MTGFARRIDPALADWIDARGAFPASMVDRIVPATTPGDIAALAAATGYHDAGMVKTEPFSQWVVEDRFCHRRPPLERVGVQITDDVAGWERAKLRLLNGAHSALAYLGALAGHVHVHEAMAAPGFAAYVDRLWDEAEATLSPPAGFDATTYREALKARFGNAALNHSLVQIAMDGSQKLPQRLLASLRDARAAAAPFRRSSSPSPPGCAGSSGKTRPAPPSQSTTRSPGRRERRCDRPAATPSRPCGR